MLSYIYALTLRPRKEKHKGHNPVTFEVNDLLQFLSLMFISGVADCTGTSCNRLAVIRLLRPNPPPPPPPFTDNIRVLTFGNLCTQYCTLWSCQHTLRSGQHFKE